MRQPLVDGGGHRRLHRIHGLRRVDHHAALVESSGADGMISDNFRGEANDIADEVVNGAELSAGMADGARTLETKLKTRLGPSRLVLFNGVWAHKGDWQPALQMSLAQTSDGCSFEHFARGPDGFDVHGDTWRKWGSCSTSSEQPTLRARGSR